MQFKELTRKYILFGLIIFIVVGLISARVLAKKQDEQFLQEDALYQQANQLFVQGNYTEATKIINELLFTKPNAEIVNYLGGVIAANNNEMSRAAILMQKTLDINPHKVEDAVFMLQFGEILFFAERYDDAKMVLSRCQEAGWTPEDYPEYQQRVQELLANMQTI